MGKIAKALNKDPRTSKFAQKHKKEYKPFGSQACAAACAVACAWRVHGVCSGVCMACAVACAVAQKGVRVLLPALSLAGDSVACPTLTLVLTPILPLTLRRAGDSGTGSGL